MIRKLLLGSFVTLVILSLASSYYRFVILEDYYAEAEVDCNPESESCFVWICNPEIEECTGDQDDDIWFYKVIAGTAINICDPARDEGCKKLSCIQNTDSDCEEILCDNETLDIYSYEDSCSFTENYDQ